MKCNAGIITPLLAETKRFYTQVIGWRVDFENDFYLLLGTPEGHQLSFLLPDHPSQQPLFQSAFAGQGVYVTVEVPDVDRVYERIKASGTPNP